MPRSMIEARKIIYERLRMRGDEGRSTTLTDVHFVLCEDGSTVMTYVDTTDEADALAIYFDLRPNEEFEPVRLRSDFFRPLEVVG